MTAVYTGSFDPLTRGHIDIIRRAGKLADRVVVAMLDNPGKQPLFSAHERVAFLRQEFCGVPGVEVEAVKGMLAAYVLENGIHMIIRGVRNAADFEYETLMARYNKQFTHGVDTVFLAADAAFTHISCSAVKEAARLIYRHGFEDEALLDMVTPPVRLALQTRLSERVKGRS